MTSWRTTGMLLWIWNNSTWAGIKSSKIMILILLASPSFKLRFLLRNSSTCFPWTLKVSLASSLSLKTSSPRCFGLLHGLSHYVLPFWKSKKASPFPKITSGALWWPWVTNIPLLRTTLGLRWVSKTYSWSFGATESSSLLLVLTLQLRMN